jgi:hypothetical protein
MNSKATTKIAANEAGRREAGMGNAVSRPLAALLLAAFALAAQAQAQEAVRFDWFEYVGRDAAFDAALPPGGYRNPVLAGFHSDPAITRAGDKFYLVVSTFTFFPGIPVFESADLVHWKQIGNVIERPSQLDFDGLSVSRGVFAPSIAFHDGTFYVLNTAVDSGGNYLATATNPAGPWSDDLAQEHRRHRPVAVLRRRWKSIPAQQRTAQGAALRRASRDLDAAVRPDQASRSGRARC